MPLLPDITIIEPTRGRINLRLAELWAYRDLILLFIHRDFTSRFKQNVLGPTWFFLTPLVMALVMNLVFNRIANVPTDELPGPLFYMSALFAWNLISSCFSSVAGTFRSQAPLFGKVYFPRLSVPIAYAGTALINTAVQLISFIVLFIYFAAIVDQPNFLPGWQILLLFPTILLALLLGIGFGLCFSSITAKYRDLAQALPFFTQIWLYLSAIVFPISSIPADWQFFAAFNPAIGIIGLARAALLGAPLPELPFLIGSISITALALLLGLYLFSRVERTFVDTV